MVKKARTRNLFRTIKKNGVSFFAVAFIAATSIAIFVGLQSAAMAILKETNRYFIANRMESFEITCANGITQEDIEAISSLEAVDVAEGGYSSMVLMDTGTERITIQARSLCQQMNDPAIVEGELPEAYNEVAIEQKMANEQGIGVGDTIRIDHEGMLFCENYEVTAIINEPFFCCATVQDARGKSTGGLGAASYYMMLPVEAFDASYYSDCYTTAFLKIYALDEEFYFSNEYKEKETALLETFKELGQERAALRYHTLKNDAQAGLEDAKKEISDKEQEWNEGVDSLDENRLLLENTLKQLEASVQMMGLATDLDEAVVTLEQYGEAGVPLKMAIEEYQDSVIALADAESDLEKAGKELEEAKADLKEAEEQAEEISLKDWIVSGRNDVGDIRGVKTLVDGIYGLSYSMSIIFLLVATVVCHAAISRMIDEQRSLIGAQKALGFRSSEILKDYMLYNTICALLGILIGWLGSVIIVEVLVVHIFMAHFLLESVALTFVWKSAILTAAICLAIFLATTYFACAKLVCLPATELLRGEVPARTKAFFFEKWKSFQKMNLYTRTMIKNVLSDKGRMMTTIMGVVGCIGLLVICFSLKLAIENAPDLQFRDYYLFENRLVVDSQKGSVNDFKEVLSDEKISYLAVQDKLKNFRVDGGDWESAHVVAASDYDSLQDFMVTEDVQTKTIAAIPKNGVLVSRKCAELFQLEEGSRVEFMDSEGNPKECMVSGVIEHYLPYHLFVTTDSYYRKMMGEETDECVFLLKGDISGLYERVSTMDGYLSLRDNSEFEETAGGVNLVILICLALSAVMAVLVLLNQIVMHINRKARELAVMRINGYSLKQTRAYVYKDNVVLTIIGLIVGSGFGVILSYIVVCIIETGASRYVRTPNLVACLLACCVGAVFSVIVNLIALRRIKHLNLTNVSGN